jgi:hypothetical protein
MNKKPGKSKKPAKPAPKRKIAIKDLKAHPSLRQALCRHFLKAG